MYSMKLFTTLTALSLLAIASCVHAASPQNPSTAPILVELFTSEGCSSCPPVDQFVQKLDASQPVPGAQLIVLSEHVDYFNSEGWKDPYSSSLFTERQKSYDTSMGVTNPYTPQIIINGSITLPLSDQQKMIDVFKTEEAKPILPIQISAVTFETTAVHAHITVNNTDSKEKGDVYVVAALNSAESQVTSGENNNRHLTHVAVVQELVKAGKLQKGKAFDKDVLIKLKAGTNPANIRIIVFIQKSDGGKVLGSALWKNQ